MPRRRCQLRVCDPQIFLLLTLLARPHRHAPILQTKSVDTSTLSVHESKLAPRAAKGPRRDDQDSDHFKRSVTAPNRPQYQSATIIRAHRDNTHASAARCSFRTTRTSVVPDPSAKARKKNGGIPTANATEEAGEAHAVELTLPQENVFTRRESQLRLAAFFRCAHGPCHRNPKPYRRCRLEFLHRCWVRLAGRCLPRCQLRSPEHRLC